jgi:small-conductance mechanosensitive channel
MTAPFADTIMPYVTGSAKQFVAAIIGYLPKLFTLILIVAALRYLLRFIRFAATALENEEIQLEGFEPDWAEPTYKLIRGLLILVGIMISYPYLPGAGSEIFKGFSIFVGALVTLGATGAINNVISGIVLTYTRAFRVGDRVQIGNRLGDVLEKKLFVTRLRTLENEEITMPNGMLLGGSITNLSAAKGSDGLALHVTAGIGYDVDWRKVHELMKKGAKQTAGVLTKPEPFVLETELGGFAVNYTLIAYAEEPKRARHISAQLRRNILDLFNAEGVEIMTPSIAAVRDGNQPAIPEEYNPKPFSIPGIQVLSHSGKL